MDKKKEAQLNKIVDEMQKKYGKEAVNFLGNSKVEPLPRIPSQSIAIDQVTGGGYPLGRIIEVFGGESSGKTTACYHAIAEAQKMFPDQFCALIDSEFSFDPVYAESLGVKVDELVIAQPDSGTDGFEILQGLIEKGASLIVVDSVAAMVPREETEENDYGKSMIGLQARMMSKALRKLTSIIGRHKAVVIFTNQTREKVGVMYGDPTTTSGGNSLKFYASIRLKFTKIGKVEEGTSDNKVATSIRTRVECVKNKTFPPFRRSEFHIVFGKGIDNEGAIFDAILSSGLIQTKGAGWYAYEGKNVAQGTTKLKQWLEENLAIYEKMKAQVTGASVAESGTAPEQPPEKDADTMTDEEIASTAVEEIGEISG